MKILNKHKDQIPEGAHYMGRPSPLGNPFSHLPNTRAQFRVATREAAVEAYRLWLWQQIKGKNKPVLNALRALSEDSVLVCWCVPLPCHCNVIEKAWRYLNRQGWPD